METTGGITLNDKDWIKALREKRQRYGVSQNRLAISAGITREYLTKIETGKAVPSEKLKETLTKELERYNPDVPLTRGVQKIEKRA